MCCNVRSCHQIINNIDTLIYMKLDAEIREQQLLIVKFEVKKKPTMCSNIVHNVQ